MFGTAGGDGVRSGVGGGEGVRRGGTGREEKSVFEVVDLANILSFGDQVVWRAAGVMSLFRRKRIIGAVLDVVDCILIRWSARPWSLMCRRIIYSALIRN